MPQGNLNRPQSQALDWEVEGHASTGSGIQDSTLHIAKTMRHNAWAPQFQKLHIPTQNRNQQSRRRVSREKQTSLLERRFHALLNGMGTDLQWWNIELGIQMNKEKLRQPGREGGDQITDT
ncbi:hypothetical protein Nepgr_016539 [Nepenthes gracilis]|uniref:Uncharacterized protein n=1 Tax=Nepenthes gracilis TaxID=150966 RepID=A0AAD3XRQ2_NEPGR|nr:hypothetical protein Nepgr_016539 [Nepenthes gracilis]